MDPSGIFTNCHISQQTASSTHDCVVNGPQHLREVVEKQLHERNRKGWRRVVLNFTPS